VDELIRSSICHWGRTPYIRVTRTSRTLEMRGKKLSDGTPMDGLGVVCQVVAGCKEEDIANVITNEIAAGTFPSLAYSSLSPQACYGEPSGARPITTSIYDHATVTCFVIGETFTQFRPHRQNVLNQAHRACEKGDGGSLPCCKD
jgi:hypothetical protein